MSTIFPTAHGVDSWLQQFVQPHVLHIVRVAPETQDIVGADVEGPEPFGRRHYTKPHTFRVEHAPTRSPYHERIVVSDPEGALRVAQNGSVRWHVRSYGHLIEP